MTPRDPMIVDAAWSGHFLLLGDETTVNSKLRRPELSPSIAQGYNSCPASTAISRLLPWDDDPFQANQLGTRFHETGEALYALPPEERTRERAEAIMQKIADDVWAIGKLSTQDDKTLRANAANRQRWVEHQRMLMDGLFAIEDPTTIAVESIEFRMDGVKIGAGIGGEDGIPMKGFIDRTDLVPFEGALRRAIRDYKAGKAKLKPNLRFGDDYGDQMRIYNAAYIEKTGEAPLEATLLFVQGPGIRRIDLSPDATKTTLLGFRQGWETMHRSADKQMYEARPSGVCGWCPAANSCSVARITTEKARAQASTQPSAIQLGIPVIRQGATPSDALTAPGVSVPVPRATAKPAVPVTRIDPVGDDLFPITIPDAVIPDGVPTTPASHRAEVDRALADTAHVGVDGAPGRTERNYTMSDPTPDQTVSQRAEAEPYNETINGQLNLNSYAAMAVTTVVSMAYQHLRVNGMKTSPATLGKFSHVLAGILLRVQKRTTGVANFQRGANARLRSFLHTAIDQHPAPFLVAAADGSQVPAPVEEWRKWVTRIETILSACMTTAIEVYDTADQQEDPELAFAAGGELSPPPVPAA